MCQVPSMWSTRLFISVHDKTDLHWPVSTLQSIVYLVPPHEGSDHSLVIISENNYTNYMRGEQPHNKWLLKLNGHELELEVYSQA